MKNNTVRVRNNGATKHVFPQTKTSRRIGTPAEPSEFFIPSQVAKDAESALLNMERVGNAAVAFVMMNANVIENSDVNGAEWEKLEAPGFRKGSQELARIVSMDFQAMFSELCCACRKAIARIQAINTPIKKGDHPEGKFAFQSIDPQKSIYRIESIFGALKYCIELQSWALCCYHDSDHNSGCFEMKRHLETADKAIERATIDLQDCFCAVVGATSKEVVL